MDERQQQIQTGAGLTEARLNVDFIDALKKWGPWVIILIAVAVLAYVGVGRLRDSRERVRTAAFGALNEAERAGNPTNLIRVADEQAAYPGIAAKARLAAGALILDSINRGTRPGAVVLPGGEVAPEDVLTPPERTQWLATARAQYQQVLDLTQNDPAMWVHTLGAYMGLASVGENEGRFDEMKRNYQAGLELARAQGYTRTSGLFDVRLQTVESLEQPVRLYSDAEVRSRPIPLPSEPTPFLPELPEIPALPSATPADASGAPSPGAG